MKFTNLRAFAKHLLEAAPEHFASSYMIMAEDEEERKEAIHKLITALVGSKNTLEHALKVVDGEKIAATELVDELNTNSLFASRRVLHLYQAEKLKEEVIKQIENFFIHPTRSTFLVLSTSSLNRATNFYKRAEKAGIILDIEEQKPWEKSAALVQYAQEQFSRAGLSVESQLLVQIVEQTGAQKLLLEQEIEKLICFAGEMRHVTQKDVEAVCIKTSHENGWQLGEAIFRRDALKAINIIRVLLEQEGSIIALLRQLRSQFQIKYQVSSVLASGGGNNEIQQRFPYMRGNILQQNIQAAQNYGQERLKKGILAIDEAELLAKSSAVHEELLADQLVLKLTASEL